MKKRPRSSGLLLTVALEMKKDLVRGPFNLRAKQSGSDTLREPKLGNKKGSLMGWQGTTKN